MLESKGRKNMGIRTEDSIEKQDITKYDAAYDEEVG